MAVRIHPVALSTWVLAAPLKSSPPAKLQPAELAPTLPFVRPNGFCGPAQFEDKVFLFRFSFMI
jgi:hypothetical protein